MDCVQKPREILLQDERVHINGRMVCDLSQSDTLIENLQKLVDKVKDFTIEEKQKIFDVLTQWMELQERKLVSKKN